MKVINKSPLSFGERAKLSFADDAGMKSYAESKGYRYAKNNKTGEKYWAKDGNLYKLDEKGFTSGDIAEGASSILPTLGFGAGTALGTAATVGTGGLAAPVAIAGGAGTGSALGTAANIGIGKLLGVNKSSLNKSMDETATSGATGTALSLAGSVLKYGADKYAKPVVNKVTSRVSSKAKNLWNTLTGKVDDVVTENKKNVFLKNLNFKPKNTAFAEQQTKDALEIASKHLDITDTPKIMQSKLTQVRDTNADFIKKAISKAKQIISIDDFESGSLADELNSVITKNPNNPQLTKLLKTFDDKLSSNLTEQGLSGKGFKAVFDWIGSQKRTLSDQEARKAAINIYDILKSKLPQTLQNKLTEDYTIGRLLDGISKTVVKDVQKMSGDKLTAGKKILGSIFGNSGVVGKGLAGKEVLDIIRGK